MRLIAGLAAALALAGCGGGQTRAVLAFEMPWPHGATTLDATFTVPGKPVSVELGGVRLVRDRWTCLDDATAALYRIRGSSAIVALDDDATSRCAALPDLHVPRVGGYARGGGYVGEWSPGAVTYTR